MRLLDLKGKVWSALVGLVVIAAITLLGLMMVPKQAEKIGLQEACAEDDCKCPKGYGDKSPITGKVGYCYKEKREGVEYCTTGRMCCNKIGLFGSSYVLKGCDWR